LWWRGGTRLRGIGCVPRAIILDDLGDGASPGFRPGQIRRKQREGVAHGLLDLALCQIARLLQARAREIGTRELGTGEIGALKERLSEIGAGEIGAVEPGIA